ncbi:FG-GAP-like repeat-containing protein [Echinimonas agarilytica]|uniref:FG-GAP-like repeat-containing protein n=1 Tax=Echinimonas agarilytica TaxID=1215918 RepID=A0AA41W9Q6_9GAMM|nr:FG-GAP-like repeat-containing protein [Echinimonas agarilytica]MCM2680714.1 FG-GAP-like repeat-containing protein [Echinimonas agarilytica]
MKKIIKNIALISLSAVLITGCHPSDTSQISTIVPPHQPFNFEYQVSGDRTKRVVIEVDNPSEYAYISLYSGEQLLIDHLDIPTTGHQTLSALVTFKNEGEVTLQIRSNNANLAIKNLSFEPFSDITVPTFSDISVQAGLDKISSIKYGGPTIADIDNDGDYDFIVNNHNAESSKLYWNNGNGTVTRHDYDLARWFMHDLHGTAAGDYDNDGQLDLVVTQGGGNGTNPSKTNFYTNKNGTLVLTTGDVGIDRGGRGRGAKWLDMDLDGDLDLLLINETSLTQSKPQHFFYENLGDGTFAFKSVDGVQDIHQSRVLVTDFNGDHIDDLVMYAPLELWQGNGDSTFTNVSSLVPSALKDTRQISAIVDIDIDNDGDQDLYLARGKEFENGRGEKPWADFDPIGHVISYKTRGFKGVDQFDFSADDTIEFNNYYFLPVGMFRNREYPIFLGSQKQRTVLSSGGDMSIAAATAAGWPDDISEDGIYLGYLGNGKWRAALVRDEIRFWGFKFSLTGVTNFEPKFELQNRNEADYLLRNDGDRFVDVSNQWGIMPMGNSLGVTTGDFNNDTHQDLFVYRWGLISGRISDYLLLNNGQGQFDTVTMHGAADVGGPGNGDMGQAFDFDLDGKLDLLSGSEGGEWYLYQNNTSAAGNYALVRVGYSPDSNIDPISAEVVIETDTGHYRKRVGSAGAVFSQSLLNIVHFGLADAERIAKISVRWRNGETVELFDKAVNQVFDTDRLDPHLIAFDKVSDTIRHGSTQQLAVKISPAKADARLHWQSNNDSVLTVDQQGRVTAVGAANETASIVATSPANGLTAHSTLTINDWYPKPLQAFDISSSTSDLLVGDQLTFDINWVPDDADDRSLIWQSSNPDVITIDAKGIATAVGSGTASILVQATSNEALSQHIEINVSPYIEPHIIIKNAEDLKVINVGDTISVDIDYHAGSRNTVIASDEGGMRFWLRHFMYKWIPAKDIVHTDTSVLRTTEGQSSMRFSLDGLTPSNELPEGHFYQLRVTFANSEGQMVDAAIDDVQVIAKPD